MLKLIKSLRPFVWGIFLIFILLFAQAMADLSLPSYMGNIVNVGIAQNGIENAVPQAIPAAEFSKLTLFMTDAAKSQVTADYILLDKQSLSPADYDKYVKDYPGLASAPVYKLDTANKTEISSLDVIFQHSMPVVAGIEQGGLAAFGASNFTIPAGVDPFSVIAQLPAPQLDQIRAAADSQMNAIPAQVLKQYSIAYVSTQYKELGVNVGHLQNAYMWRIGALMLLLTLASASCSVVVGFISARIAAGLGYDLRSKLFNRVEHFSNIEFDKFSTASLITRSTNDITQIQLLMVMVFRIVFYAPILATGGILKVLGGDRSMLWIIAAAVGLLLTTMVVMFIVALPKFQSVQKLIDKLGLRMRETLTGLMVIRAFNTGEYEKEKFDVANKDLTATTLFINRVIVFLMPVMMFIMNGTMLLIVWVGAHQIDASKMQIGDMLAFTQYAMQIIFSFLMITIVFIMLPRASVAAQRVSEVLETEPVINDPKEAKYFDDSLKGVVEFQNVSFRYPGAEGDVLKDITFTARPGQTTAFIGSTGSGKSTLINLVPRFYDVTSGKVLVDGVDVRDVTQHDLREKIGYVSQKAVLFSGTIDSNIRYANENATSDEIAKYAETAQAIDFIRVSDNGFDTAVSQGGTNFSGGQKQRLAIARALAKKPEIYIFDDALSALDFKTDAALRRALKKETSNATVLLVTQRISTVLNADKIVVLDEGKIVGVGTHQELMESCGVYREIALSQMSKEELVA